MAGQILNSRIRNLSGMRFGRLLVTSKWQIIGGVVRWLCNCDCGNEVYVRRGNLINNSCKSCGCIRKHQTLSKEPLYNTWVGMIGRCHDKDNKDYLRYGARGISVCEIWRNDFNSFKHWAANSSRKPNTTLDRVDNEKGYSPENCRWATPKEQANNRRNNVYVTIGGITKTITQWCDLCGIPINQIRKRLQKGMDPVLALILPIIKKS